MRRLTKAYNKKKNQFNIPGFRKGKVPQKLIEKEYGVEIFYEDAANILIPDAYAEEMKDCDLEIVSRPEIDVVQLEKENHSSLQRKLCGKTRKYLWEITKD